MKKEQKKRLGMRTTAEMIDIFIDSKKSHHILYSFFIFHLQLARQLGSKSRRENKTVLTILLIRLFNLSARLLDVFFLHNRHALWCIANRSGLYGWFGTTFHFSICHMTNYFNHFYALLMNNKQISALSPPIYLEAKPFSPRGALCWRHEINMMESIVSIQRCAKTAKSPGPICKQRSLL